MAEKHYFTYNTQAGQITIQSNGDAISAIAIGKERLSGAFSPNAATNAAATQLLEYFSGKRFEFDLPLCPDGTDFQRAVWDAVSKIPYGETRTATDVAKAVGGRATHTSVGAALAKCPIDIIIPTHRVVSASGYVNRQDSRAARAETLRAFEKNNHPAR